MNDTLAALSDPTRRSIVERLTAGPATVGELAAPYNMSQQAVSKHVAYLERANLIEKRRVGRQHICALRPEPLDEIADWMERYRRLWEERFDRLDNYLRELQKKEKSDGTNDK